MLPELWGPYAWHLLHTVAYGALPDARRTPYIQFFRTYETIMPCRQCRYHFSEWIESNPLQNTKAYSKWVNELHNNVNERLGKEIWSSDQVHDYYFKNGVLQISYTELLKWLDIVVRESSEEHPHSNISEFQDYIIFFNSLKEVFPCPLFRKTLKESMETFPITDVVDPKSLQEWYAKICPLLKKQYQYLKSDVFLVYRKPGSKRWFFRKINMKGVKFIEKVDTDVILTLDNGKKRQMDLPSDADKKDMAVVTETDLEYTKKILDLVSKNK